MGGIFISYRRDDSRHAAGRLVDRLAAVYRADQLFMDVDNIDLGLDFAKVLADKVAQCDAMLVVIGPKWLDARDDEGNRRLDDSNDFVRIEVESALARDVRVIPVLVDGAEMPRAEQLPASLRSLTRRQATRLNHERFGSEAEAMTEALARIVRPGKGAGRPIDMSKSLSGIASSFFAQITGSSTATGAPTGNASVVSQSGADSLLSRSARIAGNFLYGFAWFYVASATILGAVMVLDGNTDEQRTVGPTMLLLGLLFAILMWRWRKRRIAAGASRWGFKTIDK